MASFFQPGDAKSTDTTQVTPSPAAQASAEFRARILGQLLDAAAQPRTSFSQFAGGAPLQPLLPGGLSAGIPQLLQAMAQPGAFTSTKTDVATGRPPTPSTFSDLAQLGALGALLYQSGLVPDAISGLHSLLAPVGGPLSLSNIPTAGLGSSSVADANVLDALGGVTADTGQVPFADAGNASNDLLSSILAFSGY